MKIREALEKLHNQRLRVRQSLRIMSNPEFESWLKEQPEPDKVLQDLVNGECSKYKVTGLEDYSKTHLRQIASKLQITLYTRMDREELIEEIRHEQDKRNSRNSKSGGEVPTTD